MKRLTALILIVCLMTTAKAQNKKWKLHYNGYLNNLQGAIFDTLKNNIYSYNLIHNRLNFGLNYGTKFLFDLSVRNRIYWGDFTNLTGAGNFAAILERAQGFFDLSHNIEAQNSYIFNSQIDRLFVKLTAGHFELTLGRQRINWAQTFVWNPINIFNTYSFLEPDYPEKPGTDAADIIYFWGTSSSIEAAASLDRDTNLTAAIKLTSTFKTFDINFITAYYKNTRWSVATGWAGYINNLIWRGEINLLLDKKNLGLDNLLLSTELDYTFANNITVAAELAYNHKGQNNLGKFLTDGSGLLAALFYAPDDINLITLAQFNAFARTTFRISPLINANAGIMITAEEFGYLFLPSINFSLSQNVDLEILAQIGHFEADIPYRNILPPTRVKLNNRMIFLKLSYNFGK